MATKVATGSRANVAAGSSVSPSSPAATAGNTLVLQVSFADTAGSIGESLSAPAGWSVARAPAAVTAAGIGVVGLACFYKTAAGGVETPTINTPGGAGGFYANAVITEWSGLGAIDSAANASSIVNNASAASTTGQTVPATGTLAAANSTAFTMLSVVCGSGLANAGIALGGTGWSTEAQDQNTSTSVGSYFADKSVAGTGSVNDAVFSWTSDATMAAYQAHVVVFSDVPASVSLTVDRASISIAGRDVTLTPPTPQKLRPDADIVQGTWVPSAGSPFELWRMLDETSPDDSDYIYTNSNSECEVSLTSGVDPGTDTGHVMRVRLKGEDGASLTVTLKQGGSGGTTIATRTVNPAPTVPTTYEWALTTLEASAITDYSNLAINIQATR